MRQVAILTLAAAGNAAFTLLVLWLLFVGACEIVGGQRPRPWELAGAASRRVHVGMPLDDAVSEHRSAEGFTGQTLCWRRTLEPSGTVQSRHVLLYGRQDPRVAGVVLIRAQGPPGAEVLIGIYSVDEYDRGSIMSCRDVDPP